MAKDKPKEFWYDFYEQLGEGIASHKEELDALKKAEKSGKIKKGSMEWYKKEVNGEIQRLEKKRKEVKGLI